MDNDTLNKLIGLRRQAETAFLETIVERLTTRQVTSGDLAVISHFLIKQGFDISDDRLPRSLASVMAAMEQASTPKALPTSPLTLIPLAPEQDDVDLPPRVA